MTANTKGKESKDSKHEENSREGRKNKHKENRMKGGQRKTEKELDRVQVEPKTLKYSSVHVIYTNTVKNKIRVSYSFLSLHLNILHEYSSHLSQGWVEEFYTNKSQKPI